MALPIRTTLDDVRDVCRYLSTKPTGATVTEAKQVLDSKRLDGRKLTAMKFWLLIEETDAGKLKLTQDGRLFAKGDGNEATVMLKIVKRVPAYSAIIERAAHRHEDSLDTTEIGAHWHDHFNEEAGDNDTMLKDRAVCFFHVASGAGLGSLIAGRKGSATRISFLADALNNYISDIGVTAPLPAEVVVTDDEQEDDQIGEEEAKDDTSDGNVKQHKEINLGQSIFIAHGKNKKPLDQLKKS